MRFGAGPLRTLAGTLLLSAVRRRSKTCRLQRPGDQSLLHVVSHHAVWYSRIHNYSTARKSSVLNGIAYKCAKDIWFGPITGARTPLPDSSHTGTYEHSRGGRYCRSEDAKVGFADPNVIDNAWLLQLVDWRSKTREPREPGIAAGRDSTPGR
jgi:hypothetical protein